LRFVRTGILDVRRQQRALGSKFTNNVHVACDFYNAKVLTGCLWLQGSFDWPTDHSVYLQNAEDMVLVSSPATRHYL